jgi:hypothetical protein
MKEGDDLRDLLVQKMQWVLVVTSSLNGARTRPARARLLSSRRRMKTGVRSQIRLQNEE